MNINRLTAFRIASLVVLVGVAFVETADAQSMVAVFSGYNDFVAVSTRTPDPWINSPNTTFYFSASTSNPNASDPDMSAIMLLNQGSTAISLTAASLSNFATDLFTFNAISGPISLAPNQNVILGAPDGTDVLSGATMINLTLGGVNYSYADAITAEAPSGVLQGANPWIGGSESQPWTAIYTPVPEPSTYAAMLGVAVLGYAVRRRQRCA